MAQSDSERRDASSERGVPNHTRRRVLQIAAAGGGLAIAGLPSSAQEGPIQLGGDTVGWEGRAPEAIAGETNPTLELQAGQTYVVEWENVDGQPHNFVIEDAEGTNVVRSEIIDEVGATQTVEFEATEAMAEYYCEVHPQSMRGEISVGTAPENGNGAEPPAETPRFFERGTEVGVSQVAEGMTAPTDFAMAEDGRMFVADQTGELWILGDGATDDDPNDDGSNGDSPNDDGSEYDDADDCGSADDDSGDDSDDDDSDDDSDDDGFDDDSDDDGAAGDTPSRQVGDEPAVDLTDRMVTLGEFAGSYANPESEYEERGLLGVELHPEFADNGRLFLHYSAPPNEDTPEGWSHVEVVSEFAMADDGQSVDPDSEQVLMEFQKPQYNHDAGPIAFGPEGYLYVPMGDGGGANDDMYGHVDDWYDANTGGNGQNTTENLLGGIHRIDVDGEGDTGGDDRPYGIPEDNPLVDAEGQRDEYYSWGWRNPFGITVDSDGRMIVADAGQNLFEEANVVERGGNYGWNVKEGTHCFSTEDPGQPPETCPDSVDEDVPAPRGGEELIDPVVEYPHNYMGTPVGIVIAGGHVYEADEIDGLQGAYVFGDWTRDAARQAPDGRLFAARPGPEDDGSDNGSDDDSTADDGETGTDDGTEGDGMGGGETDDDAEGDQVVPRDELWEMEELVIAGSEDGSLHRFVRQFGQGRDGEVFVLVNQRGIPEGDTGAVLQLVPPGEGDQIEAPEMPEEEDAGGNGEESTTEDEGE